MCANNDLFTFSDVPTLMNPTNMFKHVLPVIMRYERYIKQVEMLC